MTFIAGSFERTGSAERFRTKKNGLKFAVERHASSSPGLLKRDCRAAPKRHTEEGGPEETCGGWARDV